MPGRIVLFGATGYTGRLTAEALVKRGAKPLLAGRSGGKLRDLAAELGGDLETATADVADRPSVAALVDPDDVMLSTVGPFVRWGGPAIEAAIAAGAHYLDSTGEAQFIREVFESYGPRAAKSGSALLTAFGYDWVPGNLAGALALEGAGEAATHLDIGYFVTGAGLGGMSGGTRASAAGVMLDPTFAWRNGRIVVQRAGKQFKKFDLRGRQCPAISVGSTEHYSLPRVFPQLRDVGVYLGWFGGATRAMQVGSAAMEGAQKIPGVAKGLRATFAKLVRGSTGGPGAEARARGGSRIVAVARDEAGRSLAEVLLEGIDGYTFTAEILAWGAMQALDGAIAGAGALGPVEAFGVKGLREGVESAGLRVVSGNTPG